MKNNSSSIGFLFIGLIIGLLATSGIYFSSDIHSYSGSMHQLNLYGHVNTTSNDDGGSFLYYVYKTDNLTRTELQALKVLSSEYDHIEIQSESQIERHTELMWYENVLLYENDISRHDLEWIVNQWKEANSK